MTGVVAPVLRFERKDREGKQNEENREEKKGKNLGLFDFKTPLDTTEYRLFAN